ncbi:uncharacterized protein PG986_005861 [Apiospora aurea]|uniref:Uncharacterized protein n=1 Tax=Apiospora aurea TaxID=335848 RepID=A0ABR1QJ66_9PEZI
MIRLSHRPMLNAQHHVCGPAVVHPDRDPGALPARPRHGHDARPENPFPHKEGGARGLEEAEQAPQHPRAPVQSPASHRDVEDPRNHGQDQLPAEPAQRRQHHVVAEHAGGPGEEAGEEVDRQPGDFPHQDRGEPRHYVYDLEARPEDGAEAATEVDEQEEHGGEEEEVGDGAVVPLLLQMVYACTDGAVIVVAVACAGAGAGAGAVGRTLLLGSQCCCYTRLIVGRGWWYCPPPIGSSRVLFPRELGRVEVAVAVMGILVPPVGLAVRGVPLDGFLELPANVLGQCPFLFELPRMFLLDVLLDLFPPCLVFSLPPLELEHILLELFNLDLSKGLSLAHRG